MRQQTSIPAFAASLFLITGGSAMAAQSDAPRTTHPLMPGIRSAEIWNRDWPRVLHDKQITGFSPLPLGMREGPEEWREIEVGGEIGWIERVPMPGGGHGFLVADGRIRLVDATGAVKWEHRGDGAFAWCGDLRGDGRQVVILVKANRLVVLDLATGETRWQGELGPPHALLRAQVADILPDRRGLEVAVFMQYGEDGMLLSFAGGDEPETIWRRKVVADGEWDERADHGCDIRLDLSVPGEPLIWNVRHHRVRGFDARTGRTVSELVYELGGGQRRKLRSVGYRPRTRWRSVCPRRERVRFRRTSTA